MSTRPVVLLDCDGPLAAFTEAYLDALLDLTSCPMSTKDVDRWDIHECAQFKRIADLRGYPDHYELRRAVDARVVEPGFCSGINPHAEAMRAVRELAEFATVYVVTSPWDSSPTWMYERLHWVAKHFPDIGRRRVIQTAQKHLVRGDVFVDDKPAHVEEWAKAWPDGAAILFDMHHNQRIEGGLTRGMWSDVLAAARLKCTGDDPMNWLDFLRGEMKQQRVTTNEVLDLHEDVARMHKRAKDLAQGSVYERLEPILTTLREIAKSTALDEAWDRRRVAAHSEGDGGRDG